MMRRADIQGLRAFAVLSVILYHVGMPGLSGGFVGVDVFFVISGFLITRNLYDRSDLSVLQYLMEFWGARAKRLLPNGLLALLFALAAAILLLPYYRARDVSGDIASAAAFYANVHFAQAAVDYFRHDDPQSPVLHFWSLSVEEQFYFLLPFAMLLTRLARRQRLLAINALLIATIIFSFAWAQRALHVSQPSAYFLLQDRMWQLAVGGLLGVNFGTVQRLPAGMRSTLPVLGVSLIAIAVVTYGSVDYPGVWALAPTIGASLVLMADDAGPIQRLLGCRLASWIGDRSYSLYLWHFPLLAIAAERFDGAIGPRLFALAVGLCLALAAYQLVERPIHRSSIGFRAPLRCLAAGVAGVAAVFAIGLGVGAAPPPLEVRVRTEAIEAAAHDFGRNYPDDCHLTFEQIDQPPCEYGDLSASKTVVLFGDSHAAQWFNPLVAAAVRTGWKVKAWTKTSCPAADVDIWYPPSKATYTQCQIWRSKILAAMIKDPPSAIIIGDYSRYFGWIEDRRTGAVLDDDQAATDYKDGLDRTVSKLAASGAKIFVIRDNPMMTPKYLDCLAYENDCATPQRQALAGMDADPSVFPAQARVIDFSEEICPDANCPATKDGKIIYQDNLHLAASYTATFEPEFENILKSLKLSQPLP